MSEGIIEKQKENKMGTMPVLKLIFTMSLPSMFSMIVQAMYNVVDSMYVSWINDDALNALSLANPIQLFAVAVSVGTGIGVNSLISRKLGEGRRDEASSAATHGLILAVCSWVVFAIIGGFFTNLFFSMYTDNETVIAMGCQYLSCVLVFSFGLFLEVAVEKILQATGNMLYPMVFQLTGAIINIVFDPVFIFGFAGIPAFGVLGAAIATVIGQIVAMIVSILVLLFKKHEVKVTFKNFRIKLHIIKSIYAVGFPAIIMQSISSVMMLALNGILTSISAAYVNVFGVYFKLQSFIFMPVFGLTHGVMPIIGYNFGARNKERLLSALKYGLLIAMCIMSVGTALFWITPEYLLRIFNATDEMLSVGIKAFHIISLCFIPASLGILMSTLFQAIGRGFNSMMISLLRQLCVLIPAAYILAKFNYEMVWFAFPIAEMAALVIALFLYRRIKRKIIDKL